MFLDEIGEMTLRMQGLLLRFLETGELQKVGADRAAGRVNVRVIAATNRNLRDMIGQGTFREDLFYRLNVIHLVVPPLRERREDIPRSSSTSCERFTRNGACAARRSPPEAHGGAGRVLLAGQRARAGERDRAARGDGRGRYDRSSRTCRSKFARARASTSRGHGANAAARSPTTLQAADRGTRVVLDRRLSAVHAARDHARQRPRPGAQGLEEARGNYKIVARLFNMEQRDYKRFLNFLRKHDCQLPFKEYR